MDAQEKTGTPDDGKVCCSKGKCCGKSLAALALLLIGGAGGYLCARHCPTKPEAPASAPIQPPTK